MKTNYSIYGKAHTDEVKEMVRSVMTGEGFKIIDEFDLNQGNAEKECYYRFVFDCNPLFMHELEKRGLLPNIPYLNLTIHSTNEMKSDIRVDDPDRTMTEPQRKRFKPIIPLIEESLIQALDGVMEY